MGGDGGVIAVNRRWLPQSGNHELGPDKGTRVTERERAEIRAKVCAISNEALREPVVACELGYLYNKDAMLSALLDKRVPPAFSHVRGLKDLTAVKLTQNPSFSDDAGREVLPGESLPSRFTCPVTMVEMSGRHPFVVVLSTGWALSEKAIREVGISGLQGEYGPFSEDDVIRLGPSEEERHALRERMAARRKRKEGERRDKKEQKKRNREEKTSANAVTAAGSATSVNGEDAPSAASGGVNGAGDAAAAAAPAAAERKARKRARAAAADGSDGARRGGAAAAPTAGTIASDGRSVRALAEAKETVKAAKSNSAVYNSLFHGEGKGGKPATAAALFITTAGQRYSVN